MRFKKAYRNRQPWDDLKDGQGRITSRGEVVREMLASGNLGHALCTCAAGDIGRPIYTGRETIG